jgi:predicted acetyltransferase
VSSGAERFDVRLLTPDDDLGPDLALAQQAFGPVSQGEREQRAAAARLTVAAGRHLAGFRDGAQVASARYYDMRQWWRGRAVPMAGVAGVKVAPHEQGAGLGRALMTALLEQMAARGYPLSALYPATAPLYRSLGWELAGGRYEAVIPARSLRALLPPDPAAAPAPAAGAGSGAAGVPGAGSARPGAGSVFRPAGRDAAAAMTDVLSEVYAAGGDCGPSTFDVPQAAQMLGDGDSYHYLAPDGALDYRWDLARDEMFVACAAAGSAATARALWSIVASHGTIVSNVRAVVSPADPVTWLTAEPDVTLTRAEQWMLRLLDAPAALAGRGFPAGASVSVPLAVTDPQLPANSGDWRLEVSGGAAALTRAAPGPEPPLRLGARGLAALYAGTPLATLRRAGLAAGASPGADAALDAAFAATPYLIDAF